MSLLDLTRNIGGRSTCLEFDGLTPLRHDLNIEMESDEHQKIQNLDETENITKLENYRSEKRLKSWKPLRANSHSDQFFVASSN